MPPTHRQEREKAMSNHEQSEFNSGHGVHQHTPNNPNSHVRSSFSSPQKQVIREQRSVIRWSLLHIATAVCLIVGIYYGRAYIRMPDRVIVVDEAGSIYRGSSENVLCRETAENIARRCAFAFLDRSFEHDHRQLCEALFGRSAQKSLSDIIRKSKDEFTEQKIRQLPEIRKVELLPLSDAPGQCLAFVYGTLHRTGVYMKIPYSQKLKFTLGLRLVRSPDEKAFPLRVLRMTYEEKSIFDNKTTGQDGAK